jgi:hypothetical protein
VPIKVTPGNRTLSVAVKFPIAVISNRRWRRAGISSDDEVDEKAVTEEQLDTKYGMATWASG